MRKKALSCLLFFLVAFLASPTRARAQAAAWKADKPRPDVIQKLLRKAVSLQGFCSDTSTTFVDASNRVYDRADDIAALNAIGAEFIGRAAYWWSTTYNPLEERNHFKRTLRYTRALKVGHPDRVVQGGIFEHVSSGTTYARFYVKNELRGWDGIPIPQWVWKAWNTTPMPAGRTFEFDDARPKSNRGSGYNLANLGELVGDAPDVTRLEARMWLYYRACSYIASDVEALHMGQWLVIGKNDKYHATTHPQPDNYYTFLLLKAIRAFARNGSPGFAQLNGIKGARRKYVLLDCHSKQQIKYKGADLFDFYSWPVRNKNVTTQGADGTPGFYNAPVRGTELLNNFCRTDWDGAYQDHAPNLYLVELDNGASDTAAPAFGPYKPAYSWDEITWFGSQPATYRADWLRYATSWLACNEPRISLQIPARRAMSVPVRQPNGTAGFAHPYYRFNALPSGAAGLTPEVSRIKELWNHPTPRYSPAHALPNTLRGTATAPTASNVAIEFDGSVAWVDVQTRAIHQARVDRNGSSPTNWTTHCVPDVKDAAGDLLFHPSGKLFYRTVNHTLDYCEDGPHGWTHHSTGATNVADNLVFEVGNTNARVNELTVFYRSRSGGLEYVKDDGSGAWSHAVVTVAPGGADGYPVAPVDSVAGAIVCLKRGRVAIISHGDIKAYYWSGVGPTNWTEFSPTTIAPGTVRSTLTVQPDMYEPAGIATTIQLYYRSTSNGINYAHVYLPAGAPTAGGWGWDGLVPGVTDVAGDFNFLGQEYLLYRTTGNGIATVRGRCQPGPNPTQDWVREAYDVQNCARGLVRQRDGSLFYVDQRNAVQYLTWEANRCTHVSAPAQRMAAADSARAAPNRSFN